MQFTQSAISLNVADVVGSASWAKEHLGFTEAMSAEGFCSLTHPSAGFNLIYLAAGLPTFKPASAAGHADGPREPCVHAKPEGLPGQLGSRRIQPG